MNSKIYLPSDFINRNWSYSYNSSGVITVRTNNNCYTNYNTRYCDCYTVDTSHHYISSDSYSCSESYTTSNVINYSRFTDAYMYRNDIFEIIGLLLMICLVAWFMMTKLIHRLVRGLV